MNNKKINFIDFINRKEENLIGRENGEKKLKSFETKYGSLSELEKNYEVIEIIYPDWVTLMNSSFFLGFFSLRVRALGIEGFKKKYVLKINKLTHEAIYNVYVYKALMDM